jgi:hypothetical protein
MINRDTAYQKVAELVERFEEQFDSYKKAEYNETMTRRDFIDPLFKALGWDISILLFKYQDNHRLLNLKIACIFVLKAPFLSVLTTTNLDNFIQCESLKL